MDLQYDDSNLQRLFAELDPKQRLQALKGGFRREAAQVRKTAINNLRSSGLRTDREMESGIRAIVFKQKVGFRVTVGTKVKGGKGTGTKLYGFHKNRRGEVKPILMWAELGTAERRTKSNGGKHTRMWAGRSRAAHSTGRMKTYGFMAQTLDQVADTVTDNLHKEVIESVERVAKKYGCI